MQFIEVTELAGVRSAVVRFHHPDSPVRFLLYPMIRLAEAAFYREVTDRLRRDCDLVVAEGVGEVAPAADPLVDSWARLDSRERLGLVVQDVDPGTLGVPVLHPDAAGAGVQDGHRALPLRDRVTLGALTPAVLAGMRLFGTRRYLARHLTTENLLNETGRSEREALPGSENPVLGRRDSLLVEALTRLHDTASGPLTVGVLYGAAHMPAAANALTGLGHRPADTEWLTVFTLDPGPHDDAPH
ncbi:hypothetical protein ABTX35_35995 [Streptomyces sp. NPDC096080]|uniref:hypothetical protein n=1 Tax=Streptomyces sp. NPDC096080 TaxID=3156693 RepID=UPI003319469C